MSLKHALFKMEHSTKGWIEERCCTDDESGDPLSSLRNRVADRYPGGCHLRCGENLMFSLLSDIDKAMMHIWRDDPLCHP